MGLQCNEVSIHRCRGPLQKMGSTEERRLFRVYQNFNSYGRFLRVETTRGQRKSAIIIPEIDYNVGWSEVADKIIRSLGELVKPDLQKFIVPGKSFVAAANIQKWPEINFQSRALCRWN